MWDIRICILVQVYGSGRVQGAGLKLFEFEVYGLKLAGLDQRRGPLRGIRV